MLESDSDRREWWSDESLGGKVHSLKLGGEPSIPGVEPFAPRPFSPQSVQPQDRSLPDHWPQSMCMPFCLCVCMCVCILFVRVCLHVYVCVILIVVIKHKYRGFSC